MKKTTNYTRRMRLVTLTLIVTLIASLLLCGCAPSAVTPTAVLEPAEQEQPENPDVEPAVEETPVAEPDSTPVSTAPLEGRLVTDEADALCEKYEWNPEYAPLATAAYPDITDVTEWPQDMPQSVLLDYVYNGFSGGTDVNNMTLSRDLDYTDEEISDIIAAVGEYVYYTQGGDWEDIEREDARIRELVFENEETEDMLNNRTDFYKDGELKIDAFLVSHRALVYKDSGNMTRVRGLMFCKCEHSNGEMADNLFIEPDKLYCAVVEYVVADPELTANYFGTEIWSNEKYYVISNIGFGGGFKEATDVETAIYEATKAAA